jgi:hypothetical protein
MTDCRVSPQSQPPPPQNDPNTPWITLLNYLPVVGLPPSARAVTGSRAPLKSAMAWVQWSNKTQIPPIYLNHPPSDNPPVLPCIEIQPWTKTLDRQKLPVYKIVETSPGVLPGTGSAANTMIGAKLYLKNLPPKAGSPVLCPAGGVCA